MAWIKDKPPVTNDELGKWLELVLDLQRTGLPVGNWSLDVLAKISIAISLKRIAESLEKEHQPKED